MSGKWEVAGKNKKAAPIGKKAAKKQKKELPTAEDAEGGESFSISNPLKESRNIFNLMQDESDLPEKQPKSEMKENIITKPRVSSAKSKPKKKTSPVAQNKREERQVFLDQLDAFDVSDLKQLISDVKERFPSAPRIWLKDIQSYIQMKITVKESDPGFMMYMAGYPYNMLEADLQQFLAKFFKQIPDHIMIGFYCEVLDTLARDTRNGVCGYHHRILLQGIASCCPKTVHSKEVSDKLQAVIEDSVTRTKECVAMLWVLQMIPRNKIETKVKVWFTWMLPILQTHKTERPVQDYIFKCLENILGEVCEVNEPIELAPSDFFGYFDLVFTPNSHLYPHIHVLLLEMLDPVKCLAFSHSPDTRLKSFFPSLLIRLQQSSTRQRDVVLQCLSECLSLDAQCLGLWQQLFLKHLTSSLSLLEHIQDNWEVVIRTFNKQSFKQTLDYLILNLAPCPGKGKVKESQKRALALCTDMKHALGSPVKSALKLALLVMLVLGSVFVLHDLKEFGSFQASKTGQAYNSLVQHDAVRQVMANVKECSATMQHYGRVHVPLLTEYLYTAYNSVSSTLALAALLARDYLNYLLENREQIAEQTRAGVVDAWERLYLFARSLTSPEQAEWLEQQLAGLLERGWEYWVWLSGVLAGLGREGALLAQEGAAQAHSFITNNFINEPVTVERLKDWGLQSCSWARDTASYTYEMVLNATFPSN